MRVRRSGRPAAWAAPLRPFRPLAGGLVLGLVLGLSLGLGAAVPGSAAPAPGTPHAGVETPTGEHAATVSTVLLLSGDRATHTAYPDGTATVTVDAAERPDGAPVAFEMVESADGHYVIPTDAQPLLAEGVLDTELFNVTTLVEDGLADADELPVIVTADPGAPTAKRSGVLSGSAPTATLSSIDATAYELDGGETTALWDDLTAESNRDARTASAGAKIWLDRAVEVVLDESVPQIGAPELWDAGYDGSGVAVAVLDTGVDPNHPDLAGQVVDTANFTTDPSAVDGHGHGTHVASTVAGTGAASGGTYQGVAPGADLLIGKVLPDSGTGPTSAVIAGMEWAAQAGADIVSLSLGGPVTDGTDPASRALEALTAQTGALFVVASGNNEGDAAVNSPGAASSALTVGAVDKVDELASFSNRGPRRGDAAVKPELTAPGAGIVAARAGGTSMGTPVDDYYTSAGGTSMATPHVSGAAALLRQAHPEWTAEQLKDALVSTAEPGGYTTFQGGAGRIDVARAAGAAVTGPATANIGMFPAPYDEPRTQTLTYRNHTGAPVPLELAASGHAWTGEDLPAGAVTLDASQLTVPAGGTAEVDLTVDPGPGEVGAYTGVVTASAGELALRTPFGYYKSTGSYELTVRAVDFRGDPFDGEPLRAIKLDGSQPNDPFHTVETWAWSDENGEVRLPVAGGRYDVYGNVSNTWDFGTDRLTSLAETELEVTGDMVVNLDGAKAVRVEPHWPEPVDVKASSATYHRGFVNGDLTTEFATGWARQYSSTHLYMQPAEVSTGWLEVTDNWQVTNALVASAEVRSGSRSVPITPRYHNLNAAPVLAGEHDLHLVPAGTGTPEELAAADVAGKVALVRIPVPPDAEPNPVTYAFRRYEDATADAAALGAAGILFYIDEPGAIAGPGNPDGYEILQLAIPWREGVRVESLLRSGRPDRVRLVLSAARDPERIYRVKVLHEDPSLPSPRRQVDVDELVAIPTRYHSDEPDYQQRMFSSAFTPRERTVSGLTPSYWAPFEATEFVLPGENLRWHRQAEQLGPAPGTAAAHPLYTREMFLPGDQPAPEAWFQTPIRTGAADPPAPAWWSTAFCSFCRHGDRFLPGLYYLDSDPRHLQRSYLLEGSTYRMYAGDEEIPNSGSALSPWFALDPAPGMYRLELAGIQPAVPRLRTLAPRIDTSWTFSSRRPFADGAPAGYRCPFSAEPGGCEFPSLLQLNYQLGLDLLNRAPAGTSHTFDVVVAPHSAADWSARFVVLRLRYSTDDGATWTMARVRPFGRDPGRFEVTVRHPALAEAGGGVWLRAEAWDTDGNRVEQTIERAYHLR